MAIYTKRGDGGETSLCTKGKGRRKKISKDSLIIEVLGTIDELNSLLGVTISFSNNSEITSYLKNIQKNLMTISSIIVGKKLNYSVTETKKLERIIDRMEKNLPPLKHFVLPGGTVFTSHLQYARSLARKTERIVVGLSKEEKVSSKVMAYLNRLSDFLFILARHVNYDTKINEEVWFGINKK